MLKTGFFGPAGGQLLHIKGEVSYEQVEPTKTFYTVQSTTWLINFYVLFEIDEHPHGTKLVQFVEIV